VNLKKKVFFSSFFFLLTYSREDFNVGYFRAAMGEGGVLGRCQFHFYPVPYFPYMHPAPTNHILSEGFLISFFFSFLLILSFLVWITQHITHTQPTDDKNSHTIHNRETNSPRLLFCLCTFYLSACGTYSRLTDLTGLDWTR